MKATGIVRRIDDLGRVVIPKEIRRTMRIREGDPLEIYTDNDGEVIFKKYSPIGELSAFATQYAEVLSKIGGYPVVVCDRDHVITVSGASKKEFVDQRISPAYEQAMENRRVLSSVDAEPILPFAGAPMAATVLAPILAQGDVIGSVSLLGDGQAAQQPGETEIKLVTVAAAFLGRQMEE